MTDSRPELRAAIDAQRARIARADARGVQGLAPFREDLALTELALLALTRSHPLPPGGRQGSPAMSARRKLLLAMRRRVKVMGPLTCELLEVEPSRSRYRWTCSTCGHAWSEWQVMACELARKFAAYWGEAVTGVCPACTRTARDERYPLTSPGADKDPT